MDQLPKEIRHIIADWTGQISKESLQALGLVSREWNEIAKEFLNQHIIIRLREGRNPIIPDDQRILIHARQLSLVAEWRPYFPQKTSLSNHRKPLARDKPDNHKSHISSLLEGAFSGDHSVPGAGFYVRGDWSPVIDLIRLIPRLHEVNLLVFHGGPVELFEALSQYHPTCRVSIFSTLIKKNPIRWDSFPSIDPVWISSPMLYAVHLTCEEYYPVLSEDPDRILQNIVLHAPNLKKIALRIRGRDNGQALRERLHEASVDMANKNDKPPGSARIETMSWPLHTDMTATQFQDWHTVTDLSVLKSWTVGCIKDSTLLQSIMDIRPFKQLKQLTLAVFAPKGDGPRFWRAAESMFSSLPPLTYLCLLGVYHPGFLNNVLSYGHGQTLLELKLHEQISPYPLARGVSLPRLCKKGQAGPIFSTEQVRELGRYCQLVRKLQICVQRYPGPQTDMSSALGRFPSLKELDLVLNCLPQMDANGMPVPPRELTEFEKGLVAEFGRGSDVCPSWFIRDCMVNCAMSENFVKAFFTHIRKSQEHLIQLIIHPLFGQLDQYSGSEQYPRFPQGVSKFIHQRFFTNLTSVWTVRKDNEVKLRAMCEKPFNPAHLKKYPDEILSIFRSTIMWEMRPEIIT
ncbi:hypothetical protein N7520_003272 [Penicillium odoratum]|uniref:uncharacterized protein n=1 Tax=Penicillium odoratum TaxID=1167516 RepID=UPI002547D97A|nr:uncharacterized protein N7520_003272 [Penicillium odoratum]KAJ5768713.1 hypothetical protein N7520_003272 [Penicillium odoratum]